MLMMRPRQLRQSSWRSKELSRWLAGPLGANAARPQPLACAAAFSQNPLSEAVRREREEDLN
jgi:hypothetical protein